MSFTAGPESGDMLATELTITSSVLNCADVPVTLDPIGGEISATDNGAGGCFYEVSSMTFENISVMCDTSTVDFTNVSVALSSTATGEEVSVPSGGGAMTGNQPITISGMASLTGGGGSVPATAVDFEGTTPGGSATLSATATTATYANTTHTLATSTFDVDVGGTVTVTMVLTGLTGSVTMTVE